MRAALRPVVALAASVLALAVLLRVGRGPLSTPPVTHLDQLRLWMDGRTGVDVAFAFLRLGAIAVAGYLVVTTALGLLAKTTRSARLSRLSDLATVPSVRRLVGGVAGVSLSASVATFSAPNPPPNDRIAVAAQADPPSQGLVIERLPAAQPEPHHGTATMHVVPAAQNTPPAIPTWTVGAGESLWTKSESVLADAWGRAPTDREIMPYWTSLIDANRSRLADADNPDLIFSGQVFELPAPPTG